MTRIAAIYIRCSTKEQEKEGYSLEYQEEKCKEYISKKEFSHFRTYSDAGVSGTTEADKRPALSKLFEDMKMRKFDVIVFHAFDRLARKMTVAYQIVSILERYKITIAECQHDIDTLSVDGQTRMAMFFTFAQMEHGTIKERSKLGRGIKKDRYGWTGGRVPYGYSLIDKNKEQNKENKEHKDSKPVINPDEATIIKIIYNMYWLDEYPITKIPLLLDKQGFTIGKYQGNNWNPTKVRRILREHKDKYDGGLMNDNKVGILWDKILDKEYPNYPRIKKK